VFYFAERIGKADKQRRLTAQSVETVGTKIRLEDSFVPGREIDQANQKPRLAAGP